MNQLPADALAIAEPFIERHVAKLFRDLPEADAEDAAQNVRLLLLERIIPAFDSSRGQLAPYLNISVRNAVRDERRKLTAGPTNCELTEADEAEIGAKRHRAGKGADPTDEHLSNAIFENPNLFFGDRIARFIKESIDSPDRGAAATKLGIKRESAWQNASRTKRQIRKLFAGESRFELPIRKAS